MHHHCHQLSSMPPPSPTFNIEQHDTFLPFACFGGCFRSWRFRGFGGRFSTFLGVTFVSGFFSRSFGSSGCIFGDGFLAHGGLFGALFLDCWSFALFRVGATRLILSCVHEICHVHQTRTISHSKTRRTSSDTTWADAWARPTKPSMVGFFDANCKLHTNFYKTSTAPRSSMRKTFRSFFWIFESEKDSFVLRVIT